MTASNDHPPLLAAENVTTSFPVREGLLRRQVDEIRAVDDVSLEVYPGETVGLIGESGSGKSTFAHTTTGLAEPTAGELRFEGQPVTEMDPGTRQSFRRRVQLIVQDPDDAFNPRMTVGEIVAEPLRLNGMGDAERRQRIVADVLDRVDLDPSAGDRHPHSFSGGERQRIAIARALSVNPDLIVADEPTSSVDTRVRADLVGLLNELRREHDIAILWITHALDVVRSVADRVAVMYLGQVVETGPTDAVLDAPAHPYTQVLAEAAPTFDAEAPHAVSELTTTVPDARDPPEGCRYHTRCPAVIPPPEVDCDEAEWTGIATLWAQLKTGETPAGEGEAEAGTMERIREATNLPMTFGDPNVEDAVQEAVNALATGDHASAFQALDELMRPICADEEPDEHPLDDRRVTCHRYDAERPGDQLV